MITNFSTYFGPGVKQLDEMFAGRELGQGHFQGARLVGADVPRAVHDGHPASSESSLDTVSAPAPDGTTCASIRNHVYELAAAGF